MENGGTLVIQGVKLGGVSTGGGAESWGRVERALYTNWAGLDFEQAVSTENVCSFFIFKKKTYIKKL